MSLYLESRVWSDEIWSGSDSEHTLKFCVNLRKSVAEFMAMIRQASTEESMCHTRVFEWKSPNSMRQKKATGVKTKVKSMLTVFFDIKEIFDEEFILARKTDNSASTVMFYDDFAPNFGNKRNGCCIKTTHLFTREFLTKNNMAVILHIPYLPDLAPCDFSVSSASDTNDVIKAES
jgi:hypothetical protein